MTTPSPNPHRWRMLAAIIAVLIMTPLDGSALNVVLPVLQREFHLQLGQVAWVTLAYLLVIGSLMLAAGRLGDLWGFRRVYLGGVAVFVAASAACGLAPSFGWLVAARAVQGVGACMIMALAPAIATALFPPHERGRALGLVGMGVAGGLVAGPTLGGLLASAFSWRAIFFINLPIGLIAGLWCWRVLPELASRGHRRLDWAGALCTMVMLGALLLALTRAEQLGWGSPATLGLFAVAIAAAGLLFVAERRHPEPMLDFALFRNRVFTGANLAAMLNFTGQFCALFLTPKVLQDGLGLSLAHTGLVMAALPVSVLALAPISGALSDRLGTRALAVAGELVVAAGLFGLAAAVSLRLLPAIVAALTVVGIGTGLFQSPNNSAVMGSVPRTHLGLGGGVLATMRNLGMSFGIAASSAVAVAGIQRYLDAHAGQEHPALFVGVRLGFLLGAAIVLVGAVTSAAREDGPRAG